MEEKPLQEAVPDGAAAVRYQPYPEYKQSGVEWLGNVPEHWEVISLRYACEFLNRRRIPLSAEERGRMTERICPYYGASGIIDYVEDYIFDEKTILIAEDGANLLSRSTELAFIADGKYWVNNHAHILKPIKGPFEFWANLLCIVKYDPWITGSAQPKLSKENLGCIPLPFPPPEEQQTIAAFLDYKTAKIDALIAKKKALLDKLAEKRTALISHAVTKGLDPKTPMRDSGIDWLGEIPAHWDFTMLRRMIAKPFTNGIFKKREHWGKGNKVVNVFDVYVKGDVIDETTLERVLCNDDEAEKYSVNHGDFFFVRSSLKLEGIGKSAVVLQPTEPMVFECHLVRGRPDTNMIDPEFLCYTLNSLYCKQMLISYANQVTMATLDQEKFKSLRLPLPSIKEQRKVVDYLHCQTKKFENHETVITDVITRLQEYRSALITNAVTGKIDVRSFRFPEDHITGEADAQRN